MLSSNLAQIMLGVVAAAGVAGVAILVIPAPKGTQDRQESAPQLDLIEPVQPVAVEVAPDQANAAPNPEIATPPMPPTVDTLRVDPNGSVLIAGRAAPNSVVALVIAGQEVERLTADASGGFVAFAEVAPSDQIRALNLIADPEGARVASDATYFIAPIAPEPDSAAPEVADAEDTPIAPEPETVAEDTAVPEPKPEPEMLDKPAAPAVIVADAQGVRVVQSPETNAAPDVLATVALDTITYDLSGDVLLGGRASGEGFVRVYLDNQPVTTSRIEPSGGWRTDLPDVDTGVYTLRVDQVDAEGTVVSRIETPFKREEPKVVADALAVETAQPEFQVAMTTVQPGATLWAIARERFGDGIMYVSVFEANRDRIKDPDLIYPGQVFRVPDAGN